MSRIVSLLASATEILCALGFEDQLVGRSLDCDFPESVKRRRICTEPKFPTGGTSADIDRHVKTILSEGLSVYRVHTEILRELRPGVIVTQTQCAVCAVSERDVEQALRDWLGTPPRLVSLAPDGLADVWDSILQVAQALNVPERGAAIVAQLQQRMAEIEAKARSLPERPTVACVEWIEPLMASGNWMPELVALAGGINLFGEAGKHAPGLTWVQLREHDPDVILVLPCGFDLARTRQEMPALAKQLGWSNLRAVQRGRVFLLDGNQYFNRPGPRLVESLEILAEVLHPGAFAFGHQETGWQRWPQENQTMHDWKDRLEIVPGDITKQSVDAIVNAANPALLGGGGVDGAIHDAAGPELLEECKTLGGCLRGEARITKGYRLPARHVIHTPGPIWHGGGHGEDDVLASCYRSCFDLVEQHGLRSVAFPSISTGVYGFPVERACRIALQEIRTFLERNTTVEKVVVVCFDPAVYKAYQAGMNTPD